MKRLLEKVDFNNFKIFLSTQFGEYKKTPVFIQN